MEIRITTTGNGKMQVKAIVERFNGKLEQISRGVVVSRINEDDARSFKFALEEASGVSGYYDI
jgi:hypothetical protein